MSAKRACVVNFLVEMWEVFVEAYKEKYRYGPSARMWTEELVVQWFDRQYKLIEEDYA